jgi:hypothetical protein
MAEQEKGDSPDAATPAVARFVVHFDAPLSKQDFESRLTHTDPHATATGGPQVGLPPDSWADLADADF